MKAWERRRGRRSRPKENFCEKRQVVKKRRERELREREMLYISARVGVLNTPNAGQNLLILF